MHILYPFQTLLGEITLDILLLYDMHIFKELKTSIFLCLLFVWTSNFDGLDNNFCGKNVWSSIKYNLCEHGGEKFEYKYAMSSQDYYWRL